MNSDRGLYLFEVGLLAALAAFALPAQGGHGRSVVLWATLAAAYLILELYEVELPRGDSSTMSAPVLVIAASLLHPAAAASAVVLPAVAAQVVSRVRAGRSSREYHELLRRLVLVSLAVLVIDSLNQSPLLAGTPFAYFVLSGAVVISDFLLAQLQTATLLNTPFWRQVLGSSRLEGTMLAAKTVAGVLAIVIIPVMGVWGVAALVLLLLVMRQAFSLLVNVRRAYQSTIEALARTVEAQDPARTGHAKRVSDLATEVGRQMGLRGRELERLGYAALLHDLGEVGSERDGESGDAEAPLSAADMVANVGFLGDVVSVLRACEALDDAECELSGGADEFLAYVVLVASRTDDLAHGGDVAVDSLKLRRLSRVIGDSDLGRAEAAFRTAATTVQGTLFTVGEG